jgi:hypothetical protein
MQLYLSIPHLIQHMKHLIYILFFLTPSLCFAQAVQSPEQTFAKNIRTIKLHVYGNPFAAPVLPLNGGERLELHFDDLDGNVKNYSFSFELRNADWSPTMLSSFDYVQGFSQVRLTNYRISSIALTKYTHYQAVFPDRNATPSRAGNYLLKVFQDGDPSKIIFTRRFLVVRQVADVAAQIQQPFNGMYFRSHQKVQFAVNTSKLNVANAIQQVRVCILQNDRWDNAIMDIKPTFIRQGTLEYNTENTIFPAGREWRWLDLRSLRFQSDRIEKGNYGKTSTEIIVKPDQDRSAQRFVYYKDNNGKFITDVTESINPLWQADYATVRFRFIPPDNRPFPDKNVYVLGELSDYAQQDSALMQFNNETGAYETSLFLKQGYYDYCYVTKEKGGLQPSFEFTEGNYWETENTYTVLVYYRPLGGRADELIGITKINSLTGRQGARF